jgi:hypothetical protein
LKFLISRIVGLFFPVFVDMQVEIDGDSLLEKVIIYLLALALLFFLEYQLFNSKKNGKIYFRGVVRSSDGFNFTSTRLSYSFLSGFIASYLFLTLVK